jgi:hypothetical protein
MNEQMNEQIYNKMNLLKKAFIILLAFDFIGLVLASATIFPTFKQLSGYGTLMLVIASIIVAVIIAIMLFEILAKVFLIRSTSSTFDWSSGRKGYLTVAKFLLFFNLLTIVVNVLSIGGEGATLLNQGRLYLEILLSIIEAIAAFLYLRTVKKLNMA